MAKKVTVTLVDDFDGSGAADETVEFGLDGVTYEIDLSSKNAAKLRNDLKQWVAAGRRVGGRRHAGAVDHDEIALAEDGVVVPRDQLEAGVHGAAIERVVVAATGRDAPLEIQEQRATAGALTWRLYETIARAARQKRR